MAKNNKMSDVNDHLIAQLENLRNDNMSKEELQIEIDRSKAICGIAQAINENAKTVLAAIELTSEIGDIANSELTRIGG